MGFATPVHADVSASDVAVKAAYIYNFTKFVRWPGGRGGTIRICHLGAARYAEALATIEAKSTPQHMLRVVVNPVSTDACDLVFLGTSAVRDLAAYRTKPILTVSDAKGFAADGGIIELAENDNKIRLIINVAQARANGLVIDSQLLEVAMQVIGGRQ